MAGKRPSCQNAMIRAIGAARQFVPPGATSARIGIVDRLFRGWCWPTIWRGRSTFMVEMDRDRRIQPGQRNAFAGDPRRDRPGNATFRRAVDRVGGDRASARGHPLPLRCSHAFNMNYRAVGETAGLFQSTWASRNGGEWCCSCNRVRRDRPPLLGIPGGPSSRVACAGDRSAPNWYWQSRGTRTRPDRRGVADDLPRSRYPRPPLRPRGGAAPPKRRKLIEGLKALHPTRLSPREALEALYA